MYNTTKPYTKRVLNLVRTTWKKGYIPHSSTDGIGTKGIYHWEQRTFRNAVLDALAMNLNDLAVMRAMPVELHDHILIPKEDNEAIYEIVKNLSEECKKRKIVIDSGETSIHDNIRGLEISVTINGLIKQKKFNHFVDGDFLIGIKSNGLHSNGFSKIREIFGGEFRQEFVEPTMIYSDVILNLIDKFDIHGMIHITGGAYTRLKHLQKDVIISSHTLVPQKIFYEIYQKGILDEEMYKTFNCGVGFILSVSERDSKNIVSDLKNSGLESCVIGKVVKGNGKVRIKSAFSRSEIEL